MRLKEYSALGERVYVETLSNGLHIYVIQKPGFSKSYAFFAADCGGAEKVDEVKAQCPRLEQLVMVEGAAKAGSTTMPKLKPELTPLKSFPAEKSQPRQKSPCS